MPGHPGFERFYETEARAVFATVLLLTRDARVAEDATQEAFVRALERWNRLERVSWKGGWVTTTALNVARRSLRRTRTQPQPAIPGAEEAAVDLWDAVMHLPLRQQQVVVLTYRLGMPAEEIAGVLRCRSGTVRTHLTRARRALREAVQEVEHEGV